MNQNLNEEKKRAETIEIITRAIVIYNGKILLNHTPGNPPQWYYLPGGHLEKGETIEQCLKREFKEEMAASIDMMKFVQVFENFYTDTNGNHHEINLLHEVNLSDKDPFQLKSQESHVKIAWLPIESLSQVKLLPEIIHTFLVNR